jgi:hypothetical protein
MPSRTEAVNFRISPTDLARLLAAMEWMQIPSRQEALNRALAMWLASIELHNPDHDRAET